VYVADAGANRVQILDGSGRRPAGTACRCCRVVRPTVRVGRGTACRAELHGQAL